MTDMFGSNNFIDSAMMKATASREALLSSKPSANQEDVKKAAKDFEAFFISQMMEQMFADIPTDGMFGGGHAEKVYRSMMVDEYGKMIAKKGGIGIADSVQKFMIDVQERASSITNEEGINQ